MNNPVRRVEQPTQQSGGIAKLIADLFMVSKRKENS
jgi:hypothetical protein